MKKLDKYLKSENSHFCTNNGWHKSSIKICLPKERAKFQTELDAPEILVDGIWHHNLTEIITDTFQNDSAMSFHMMPFTQCCRISEDKVIDIYSEAYLSPKMQHAYKEVNSLPQKPGDETEHIVASLMLWSTLPTSPTLVIHPCGHFISSFATNQVYSMQADVDVLPSLGVHSKGKSFMIE